MAGFVDTTVKEIESRLGELKHEVQRLEAARGALLGDGGARRRPGRPPGSTSSTSSSAAAKPAATRRGSGRSSARKPGRPRGRRGGNTRANQALELVRQRPGISIPEIASELKIEPNYLYRVMPKLVADGQVSKDGQGWRPAGS
jgi:hypothetical protein